MAKSILGTKKSRGRPVTTGTGTQIGMRWHEPLLSHIDEWANGQDDRPGRAEAVRRLVEIGLASSPGKPKRTTDKARRAASVAAEKHAMDHLDRALKGETDSVRASRKRQLTSMPGGFKKR